ncbi:MAG TPA: xanthine dehydrogenase family protein subunit M [Polyangia bacterium]|nr:xanthine dehydrogenase family protein subunit M [Polyangia bacterium]
MQPFRYIRPRDQAAALEAGHADGAAFIAGGTGLVDLLKLGVEKPLSLVDLAGAADLPAAIEETPEGIRIGALARNSDVAYHPLVRRRLPVLSQALLSGASPQLRNMATVGGNLLQRTRCAYFRDLAWPCNKRQPGSGCSALDGDNRMHAVLGLEREGAGADRCIAVHPSDMCVALVALDAVVHTQGPGGPRAIPVGELHLAPGAHPEIETVLWPGELVTHVVVPVTPLAARSHYLKVRDRASYAFALASAAVALEVRGRAVHAARVALGGVATKPWRSREAEQVLVGQPAARATFQRAAVAALAGARPRAGNRYKLELAQRVIVRALETAAAGRAT